MSRHSSQPDGRRPTLLVFTLGATGERARRRLLPRQLRSWELALHRDCLATAVDAGRAAGARLRVCSPRPLPLAADVEHRQQATGSFGERLRQAVSAERPAAGRPLVVVGSDVPGLGERQVADAFAQLRRVPERLVIGPSPDGGFYLLAAARPIDDLLGRVAWQRSDTLASLLAAARERGIEVSLLERLADLDRSADLTAWLARSRWQAKSWLDDLRRLIVALCRPPLPASLGAPRPAMAPARPGRGPPG